MAAAAEIEERAFDTAIIQSFLKDKDEVQGWIAEIEAGTNVIKHLLDESRYALATPARKAQQTD
jgi:hypothetical protein